MDALLKKTRRKEMEKTKNKLAKERIERQKERMEKQAIRTIALRSIRLPTHPEDVPAACAKYPPGPPCGLPPSSIYQEGKSGDFALRKEDVPLVPVSNSSVIEAAPEIRNIRKETTRFVPTALRVLGPQFAGQVKRSRTNVSEKKDDEGQMEKMAKKTAD